MLPFFPAAKFACIFGTNAEFVFYLSHAPIENTGLQTHRDISQLAALKTPAPNTREPPTYAWNCELTPPPNQQTVIEQRAIVKWARGWTNRSSPRSPGTGSKSTFRFQGEGALCLLQVNAPATRGYLGSVWITSTTANITRRLRCLSNGVEKRAAQKY